MKLDKEKLALKTYLSRDFIEFHVSIYLKFEEGRGRKNCYSTLKEKRPAKKLGIILFDLCQVILVLVTFYKMEVLQTGEKEERDIFLFN